MYVYPAGNKVLNFDTNGKPTNSSVIVGNTPSTTTPNTTISIAVKMIDDDINDILYNPYSFSYSSLSVNVSEEYTFVKNLTE